MTLASAPVDTASQPRVIPPDDAPILVTGSCGLVGSALVATLRASGVRVCELDVRAAEASARGDVRDAQRVRGAVDGCRGVVHLAAISRVAVAESDPALCRATNVDGTRIVVEAVRASSRAPWLLFASSREVYGQQDTLPVAESAELRPLNEYARAKVAGEAMMADARAAVVRLSNVYGTTTDHPDRVVPAFARAAVERTTLRVDGGTHAFDFTHIDDVVRGIIALVALLDAGETPPVVHLASGVATTLRELAALALEIAGTQCDIVDAPSRAYDVARFAGDPARARSLLGWTPRVALRDGLARLIARFRAR